MIPQMSKFENFNHKVSGEYLDPLNVHQTGSNESFCHCLAQKVNDAETEQLLKEFDEHFVESLLEG